MEDIEYRNTFNKQAALYNEIRPTYSEELFTTLVQAIDLPSDAQILEIGAGTGQATKPLAKRGYQITAIEPGSELATIARQELADCSNVALITSSFEEAEVSISTFDLVFAATAFHWVAEDKKFRKPFDVLKPGGHLAIIRTGHILTEDTRDFFAEAQAIYDTYYGLSEKANKYRVTNVAEVQPDTFDEELLEQIFFQVFSSRITYTTEEYLKLLNTFSETIAMEDTQRESFLKDIELLIDSRYESCVVMDYAFPLTIGRKL